jgi:putative ABC transport system substrate-binding protein
LPVVGLALLLKSDSPTAKDRILALRKGLQEEGFVEGTNYSLAVRSAEGDFNRLPQVGRELVALNPRVFVTLGFGLSPAQRAAPDVPLVFTAVAADPIALGWVQSYAHPGGMITGNVMNAVGGEETMAQKRIGFFKQLVPDLKRLGMIAPANGVLAVKAKEALQKVASQLNFEFVLYGLNTLDDLESAFAAALRDDVSGLGALRYAASLANGGHLELSHSPVSRRSRSIITALLRPGKENHRFPNRENSASDFARKLTTRARSPANFDHSNSPDFLG